MTVSKEQSQQEKSDMRNKDCAILLLKNAQGNQAIKRKDFFSVLGRFQCRVNQTCVETDVMAEMYGGIESNISWL